jgi:hypothetical protein
MKSSFQLADNIHRDTSEEIVELYYQCKGYITSSNKWVSLGKKKGYTDMDVLAVNGEETLIISVSTNLDDKNVDCLDSYFKALLDSFGRIEEFKWLLGKEVKKVLAVFTYPDKKQEKIAGRFRACGIELLYASQIFDYFKKSLVPWRQIGLKTENPLVKMMQLVDYFMK